MTGRVAFLQHSESDLPGILGDRARELGFCTRSFRADHGATALPPPESFDLLVVMGSNESTTNRSLEWIRDERQLVADAVAAEIPVLGICFGGQLLAQVLGGQVRRARKPEIGWLEVDTDDPARVPAGPWLAWHEDAFTAPPGADEVARTEVSLHAYILGIQTGVQFHPEVTAAIVRPWVDHARARGQLPRSEAEDLLSGFDTRGQAAERHARQLFDGVVERAGFTI
jgi:GMP synthase (glutamine-hydrolysing)